MRAAFPHFWDRVMAEASKAVDNLGLTINLLQRAAIRAASESGTSPSRVAPLDHGCQSAFSNDAVTDDELVGVREWQESKGGVWT